MHTRGRHSIPSVYYYITPLFILLDYLGGINVRVAVLDSFPLYKSLYYGFCVLCGVGMYALPRCTPIVALFESTINILMIVLAVIVPYFQFIEEADDVLNADLHIAGAFDIPHIVNLILAGGIAIIAFHGSLRSLEKSVTHPELDSD